jgi:hypothetical protein
MKHAPKLPLLALAALIALIPARSSIADDNGQGSANQQLFIDQRRLPEDADKKNAPTTEKKADEERKAAEEQKKLDDLAAKLKAQEEELAKRESEAREKFEDLQRLSNEVEEKRKANEDELRAREAEAQRKVEEAKRIADEARAELQAELQKQEALKAEPAGSSTDEQRNPAEPIEKSSTSASADECRDTAADVKAQPLPGGRTQILVRSPCRHGEKAGLQYGPIVMRRTLDDKGNAEFVADMFLGSDVETTITFADGQKQRVQLAAGDLSDVIKVAIVWDAPVNLDLHALEYATAPGEAGDVWSGAPRDAGAASALIANDGRAHGFMSTTDDGKGDGAKAEVFTLFANNQQSRGVIAIALDYETRGSVPSGDACDNGKYAQVPIQIFTRARKGTVDRQDGLISSAPCGKTLRTDDRYRTGVVPDIRIHKAN